MKALVTGFEPFGGDDVNPSSLAVGKLKKRIGGIVVHTAELPTSYAHSAKVLLAAIEKVKPDIVLCVGQAGGRASAGTGGTGRGAGPGVGGPADLPVDRQAAGAAPGRR